MPSPGSCHFAVCHPGMMKYIPAIMKTYFSIPQNIPSSLEVSRRRSGADPKFPDHGAASGRRAEKERRPQRADAKRSTLESRRFLRSREINRGCYRVPDIMDGERRIFQGEPGLPETPWGNALEALEWGKVVPRLCRHASSEPGRERCEAILPGTDL